MAQRISRRDSLVWVERKTVLKEINEVVQVLRFRIVHACRRSHESCPQVTRWLHNSQGFDGSL